MYLPTYEECVQIVNSNPHGCFYERRYVVNNYEISIFSYRLARYNNFILPIIDNPEINALELKGIAFVFNDDNTLYKRYIMLNKFWEIDQYKHSMYDLFKDKKIKNITTKEDGHLISFIKLPDGSIISNEKTGFISDKNILANEYLNDPIYYKFIEFCIDSDIRPLFELVVPDDMIVSYHKTSLILIKLRCNKTGKYLNFNDFEIDIPVVKNYNLGLDDIYKMMDDVEGIEGWIAHFYDDSILKVKTKWWRNIKDEN